MSTEQEYWQAVQSNDTGYDGVFVYAIATTGIYCRPSCSSRMPLRKNVQFYATPSAAETAGYRACKRCQPDADTTPQLAWVTEVCRYLEEDHAELPTLDQLAERFAISPYHLQRTFKQVVGVSPRQYADQQRQERLKVQLKQAPRVTDAIYEAGFESASAAYGQTNTFLGMTPVRYRSGGEDVAIRYTVTACPLGWMLVAATERGVCKISLGDKAEALVEELQAEYSQAEITGDDGELSAWVQSLLDYIDGTTSALPLPLDIRATAFQRKVWEALREIPYGSTRSYRELAAAVGQPTAARAVAGACAKNPVAMAIPCHRIVRENGNLGGYRWGIGRKQALLEQEAAHSEE